MDLQRKELRSLELEELSSGTTAAELQFGLLREASLLRRRREFEQQLTRVQQLRDQQREIFQQARRAREMLESVRIPFARRRLDAYPHELSGGMRQRAMIALALSCGPKLLLADEPTTALDSTMQIQILLLLRELQREFGMAVIFVTHDIGVAVEISDRVAVMYGGRIMETGALHEVVRQPAHPYTRGLLASTVIGARRGQRLEAISSWPLTSRASLPSSTCSITTPAP